MYVIWNLTEKAYLDTRKPRSYTKFYYLARVYRDRPAAVADLSGDERVIPLSEVIDNI